MLSYIYKEVIPMYRYNLPSRRSIPPNSDHIKCTKEEKNANGSNSNFVKKEGFVYPVESEVTQ